MDFRDTSDGLSDRIDPGGFSHTLVALELATRLINMRVYTPKSASSPQRLTGIAQVLAALAPLYSHSADGTRVRRLTDEEIGSGNFRKGGGELHFIDGRPPIANIAVVHASVEEVVRLLRSAVHDEDRKEYSAS